MSKDCYNTSHKLILKDKTEMTIMHCKKQKYKILNIKLMRISFCVFSFVLHHYSQLLVLTITHNKSLTMTQPSENAASE